MGTYNSMQEQPFRCFGMTICLVLCTWESCSISSSDWAVCESVILSFAGRDLKSITRSECSPTTYISLALLVSKPRPRQQRFLPPRLGTARGLKVLESCDSMCHLDGIDDALQIYSLPSLC